MTRHQQPAWLSQVHVIGETSAIKQAQRTVENAVTPNEQASAERALTTAVLVAIADELEAEEARN